MKGDPCSSGTGKPKRKWATAAAAEFVARQDARRTGTPRYSYH